MGDQGHNIPTWDAIRALVLEAQPSPSITIYMPTHKTAAPPSMREDRLRFKNLSQRAMEIARQRSDVDTGRARALERRFAAILDNLEFWEHQTESMAVCVSPEASTAFNLPVDCDEHITVDVRFHLAPVIGLLDYTQAYYVLSVTQNNPALFRGNMYGLEPARLPLPKSTGDALRIDEWKERSLQFHSVAGDAGTEWHGQGGAKDRGDDEQRVYLKMIDHILYRELDRSLPLILAGTPEMTEAYRREAHYPNILEGHIPLKGTTQETFAAARQNIYEHVIAKKHRHLAETCKQQLGRGRAASEPPAIEDALKQSRVDTVLLGIMQQTADTVRDLPAQQPVLKIKPPNAATDLAAIDYLATRAWCAGCGVALVDYALIKPHIAAATFRY
jgi:hypothetical protein